MNYDICVIGSKGFLFPFLQFGFITFTPGSEEELRVFLHEAKTKQIGIIYIEDYLCFLAEDIIDEFRFALHPIIIPLGGEGENYARKTTRLMMEKAIGMNILSY